MFGPQPRSYGFRLPSKVKRGAIVAALARRIQDGALVVVDALSASESKTKAAIELLKRLGADGKALLIDVQPDEKLGIAVRNLPGVQFLASARVGARDVMNASASDRDQGGGRKAPGPERAERQRAQSYETH